MSTATTIPVIVAPEARAHIGALGLQRQFEQILDHTVQCVPDLQLVEVGLDECLQSDSPTNAAVMIRAYVPLPQEPDVSVEWAWDRWMIANYPPAVGVHFVFVVEDAARDER